MLIFLLIITVILIGIFMINDGEEICLIFGILFFIEFVALAITIGSLVNVRTIDNKIIMYEEENAKIEMQMETLVTKYMEFEHDTFKDLSSNNAITLINLYPELKSDTLVQQQLDMYVDNNKKIREFKESKLNASNYRWWIYFGK